MKHLTSLGFLILWLIAGFAARAQVPALEAYEAFFKAHPPQKIAAPTDLNAIALASFGSPAAEIWETDGRWRTVRDVTQPALIPVLPRPGTASGTALIIAPGGGFLNLSMDTEGLEVAQYLAARGIACFVLKYRLDDTPADLDGYWNVIAARFGHINPKQTRSTLSSPAVAMAQADGLSAVAWVRGHADPLGIDARHIGFMGFSAGGITTMNVATAYRQASRPDFIGVIYGAMPKRAVPHDAPPAFILVAADDPLLGYAATPIFDAWRAAGKSAELHIYAKGGHGFGTKKQGNSSDHWLEDYFNWLVAEGWAKGQ
ncbi:MAG: alpha/beta hydrolase [Steroidobacteraceae bacterium]